MGNFVVYQKCKIKSDISFEAILHEIKRNILKNYKQENVTTTSNGLLISGNLTGAWERAITEARVRIEINDDNQLVYKAEGSTSIGAWSWVWAILGLFTGFFFAFFLYDLITYIISRDKPKVYFEEAFRAMCYEYEA